MQTMRNVPGGFRRASVREQEGRSGGEEPRRHRRETPARAAAARRCSGDDSASTPADTSAPRPPARTAPSGLFARIPTIVRELGPSIVSIAVRGPGGVGEGSGVVWGRNGHVVTNDHVVEDATSVEVVLASGEVVKIYVENGAPVEFDQPLFVIG